MKDAEIIICSTCGVEKDLHYDDEIVVYESPCKCHKVKKLDEILNSEEFKNAIRKIKLDQRTYQFPKTSAGHSKK